MSGRHLEERLREYKKAHSMYDIAISVQQAKIQKAKKGKLNFTQITQDRLLGLLSGDLTRLTKDKEALGLEITELQLKVDHFKRQQAARLTPEQVPSHQDEPVALGTRAILQGPPKAKTTTPTTQSPTGHQQQLPKGESSNQQEQAETRHKDHNDNQQPDKPIQHQATPPPLEQAQELDPCLSSLAPTGTHKPAQSADDEIHYGSPELDFGEEVDPSVNSVSNAHILDTLRVLEGLEDNGENYKPLYLS